MRMAWKASLFLNGVRSEWHEVKHFFDSSVAVEHLFIFMPWGVE